jgi:hypothetical protein
MHNWSIVGSFSPEPFEMSDMSETGIAGCTSLCGLPVSASVFVFGHPLYKEFTGTFSAGYSFSRYFTIGGSVHLCNSSVKNYGSDNAVGIDAGVSSLPLQSVCVGIVFGNINTPRLGSTGERLPYRFGVGVCAQASPGLLVTGELWKEQDFPLARRYGIEYRLVPSLAFFCGSSANPDLLSGGFRLSFSGIQIEYAAEYHHYLGMSHTVSFGLGFPPSGAAGEHGPSFDLLPSGKDY